MAVRIGVDLGGTKIEGQALTPRGQLLEKERRPTPAHDYEATLHTVVELIKSLTEKTNASVYTVGLATPGALSPQTGLVKNANSTWLIGKPLKEDLEVQLGHTVHIANDANCLVLSECRDGVASDASIVFGVILGTGVGGALVVNGQLVTGRHANAGEWGHNPLPWAHPDETPPVDCYCGQLGCLETFLSGPALAAEYQAKTGLVREPSKIVEQAAAGDEICEHILQLYEHRLARGLAAVINIVDPELIVLGGGLSNIERLFQNVPEKLKPYVFSDRVTTPLRQARYGDASGARGAAWLAR